MKSNVNFYLKKPAKGTGLSLISLQFQWSGIRLLYSIRQSIDPKLWDRDRQKVKLNSVTTKNGKHYLNDLLKNLDEVVQSAFSKESANGVPAEAQIRKHLDNFFNINQEIEDGVKSEPVTKPTLYSLIDRFLKNEILHRGVPKAEATLKTYKTTLGHLKAFEKKDGCKIDFDTITLDWFYRFMNYLRKEELKTNSLAKNVGVLKVFMSEGEALGYHTNLAFKTKRFSVSQELVDTTYLDEEEVLALGKCDLTHNTNLENVRDAFVIACLTGLRFSDFSTLKPEHFREIDGDLYIRKITQKTKEEVIIPLHDTVLEILERYKGKPGGVPKVPCNPVFNKQIKTVGRLAGLIKTGKLTSQPEKELCECISSHTGRRTFATNAYLSGVPVLDIMRITGHKTEKSFLRYVRLSRLHAAQRFSEHYKKIAGSHLKVAI